ncbi:hypothetical protein DMN91_007093 [Ooceraea biroi]|uniref:Uncharacterized protein n=1 Tax=Ooceraea biroi TaxID=2015173 RepID=A0A3L8DJY5_OOCBI|nr:hypothetical protein DMN91_007093 [Ooceraea biroi]
MSNFSDLHQISDISSISMISQCSGKLIGRVDSAQNLLDNHSGTSNKFAANNETNPIEKAMKSLVLCEESMSAHAKANIVYQCVKEAPLNHKGVLPDSTVSKLQTLLLIHELDKYMHLPSSTKHMPDELALLGIIDLPPSDLTPGEKLDVKCCVETMLREKIHDIISRQVIVHRK